MGGRPGTEWELSGSSKSSSSVSSSSGSSSGEGNCECVVCTNLNGPWHVTVLYSGDTEERRLECAAYYTPPHPCMWQIWLSEDGTDIIYQLTISYTTSTYRIDCQGYRFPTGDFESAVHFQYHRIWDRSPPPGEPITSQQIDCRDVLPGDLPLADEDTWGGEGSSCSITGTDDGPPHPH